MSNTLRKAASHAIAAYDWRVKRGLTTIGKCDSMERLRKALNTPNANVVQTGGGHPEEWAQLPNEFIKRARSLLTSIDEMRIEGHPRGPYYFGPFSEWDVHKSDQEGYSWDQITIEWPDLVTLAEDLRKALDQKG